MANMKPIFTGNFGNTTPTDLLFEIGRGSYKGITSGSVIGSNPDLPSFREETIWPGSNQYPYMPTEGTLGISSTNALDTNVKVKLIGLTAGYKLRTVEIVHINGSSQTSFGSGTLNAFMRILEVTVISGGEVPKGDLYVSKTGTGLSGGIPADPENTLAFVKRGVGTSQMGMYTVPVGHTLYATRLNTFTRKNKDCLVNLLVRPEGLTGDTSRDGFILASQYPTYQGEITLQWNPPLKVAEKTDIQLTATSLTNNTQVVANLGYILIDNSLA
jgi:hypothetical protein